MTVNPNIYHYLSDYTWPDSVADRSANLGECRSIYLVTVYSCDEIWRLKKKRNKWCKTFESIVPSDPFSGHFQPFNNVPFLNDPFNQWPHSWMTHLQMVYLLMTHSVRYFIQLIAPFKQWPNSPMNHLPIKNSINDLSDPFSQYPHSINDHIQ